MFGTEVQDEKLRNLMLSIIGAAPGQEMQAIREDGAHRCTIVPSNWDLREEGRDAPTYPAVSMIGWKRLKNVNDLLDTVLAANVPGGFIETGVFRGGSCIFAAHKLAGTDRKVYVCDSFQGCPASKWGQDAGWRFEELHYLRVPLEEVQKNFKDFNTPMENVVFVPGWFKDTLHSIKDQFSIIRLDGDLYESTMIALDNLYPQLSPGGYCIIDDWCLAPARQAAMDYRKQHGITSEIVGIDHAGVYWQK